MRLWFGEYKNQDLHEVPNRYLQWLVDYEEPPLRDHRDTKKQHLRKREQWFALLDAAEGELQGRAA